MTERKSKKRQDDRELKLDKAETATLSSSLNQPADQPVIAQAVSNYTLWPEQNSTVVAASDDLLELCWQIKELGRGRERALTVDLANRTIKRGEGGLAEKGVPFAIGLTLTLKIVNGTIDLSGSNFFLKLEANTKDVVFENVKLLGGWNASAHPPPPNINRDNLGPRSAHQGVLVASGSKVVFNNCEFAAGTLPQVQSVVRGDGASLLHLAYAVVVQDESHATFKNCKVDHEGGILVFQKSSAVITDSTLLHRGYRDYIQLWFDSSLELQNCEMSPQGKSMIGDEMKTVLCCGAAVRFETGSKVSVKSCKFSYLIGPCFFYDGGHSSITLEDVTVEHITSEEEGLIKRLKKEAEKDESLIKSTSSKLCLSLLKEQAHNYIYPGSFIYVLEPTAGSVTLTRCNVSHTLGCAVQVVGRHVRHLRWPKIGSTEKAAADPLHLLLDSCSFTDISFSGIEVAEADWWDGNGKIIKEMVSGKKFTTEISVKACVFKKIGHTGITLSETLGGSLTVSDSEIMDVGQHGVVTHSATTITGTSIGNSAAFTGHPSNIPQDPENGGEPVHMRSYVGDVVVNKKASLTLTDCKLKGNGNVGLHVLGKCTATKCLITDKAQTGVWVAEGGVATLDNVSVWNTTGGALLVEGAGSKLTATKCSIIHSLKRLLHVLKGAVVTCEDCEFMNSTDSYGLEVVDEKTSVMLKGCSITRARMAVVSLARHAQLELIDCVLSKSLTGCGLEITGMGCGFRAQGCRFTHNAMHGAYLLAHINADKQKELVKTPLPPSGPIFAKPANARTPPEGPSPIAIAEFWEVASHKIHLCDCEMSNNAMHGLLVAGNACEVALKDCTLKSNRSSGMQVDREATLRLHSVQQSGSSVGVLLKPSTRLYIQNTTLTDNKDAGIFLMQNCTARIELCKVIGVSQDPSLQDMTSADVGFTRSFSAQKSMTEANSLPSFASEGICVVGGRSSLVCKKTKIVDTNGNGLALLQGASAELNEVSISGSRKHSGLVVSGGKAKAVDCKISGHSFACVVVEDGGSLIMNNSNATGSVNECSLLVRHPKSHAQVSGGSLSGSKACGALVREGGAANLEGPAVQGSKTQYGVKAIGANSSITAKSCQITSNSGGGVAALQGASVSLTECVASSSALGPGLLSKDAGSNLVAYLCTITNNGAEGVQTLAKGAMKVLDCTVAGNGKAGASLDVRVQQQSTALVKNCSFGGSVKDPLVRCSADATSSLKVVSL